MNTRSSTAAMTSRRTTPGSPAGRCPRAVAFGARSLQDGTDVEATLLWMMAQRTGLLLIDNEFDPWALRRNEDMPIMTFAEMFGME